MAKLSQLEKDLRTKTNKTVRTVARNIMNDLAEAGPVWGGEFRDSWVARAASTGAIKFATYPYRLSDIPELPITKREMNRVTKFTIENVAPYAAVALDLKAPTKPFVYPGYGPEGDVVSRGIRPEGGRRGEIGRGSGSNRSTAPLDWYTTYARAGKMKRAISKGVKLGFA
jgi:hypothetical protein